jgi:hypothetical protein
LVVLPDIAGDAVPAEAPRVGGLRGVAGATVVPAAGQVRVLRRRYREVSEQMEKEESFIVSLFIVSLFIVRYICTRTWESLRNGVRRFKRTMSRDRYFNHFVTQSH